MEYKIEGNDLCIRISLDAIADAAISAAHNDEMRIEVKDKAALALSMGRELCECEDSGEEYYLARTLDAAIDRVIESGDPSLKFADE